MTGLSLITPSIARDFEACRLLCDSIDTYVTGFTHHYVVVSASDFPLFRSLTGPKRTIVDEATLLPKPLKPLPAALKWRNRRYWWAPGITPIYGWHVQQLLKFAMALQQPNERMMFVDSDNFFCRPCDLTPSGATPLLLDPGAIDGSEADHVTWLQNAHRLLGLPAPALPADDFIGQMIVWEKAALETIIERIESVNGQPWWKAICQTRQFSEYMIYGAAVTNDPALMARHRRVTESPAVSYWNGPPLDRAGFDRLVAQLTPEQVGMGVQSFTGTSVAMLREFALGQAANEQAA